MIKMIALEQCGRHRPGDEFDALPGHAKALVALGRANYLTEDLAAGEPGGYLTKDGAGAQRPKPLRKRSHKRKPATSPSP